MIGGDVRDYLDPTAGARPAPLGNDYEACAEPTGSSAYMEPTLQSGSDGVYNDAIDMPSDTAPTGFAANGGAFTPNGSRRTRSSIANFEALTMGAGGSSAYDMAYGVAAYDMGNNEDGMAAYDMGNNTDGMAAYDMGNSADGMAAYDMGNNSAQDEGSALYDNENQTEAPPGDNGQPAAPQPKPSQKTKASKKTKPSKKAKKPSSRAATAASSPTYQQEASGVGDGGDVLYDNQMPARGSIMLGSPGMPTGGFDFEEGIAMYDMGDSGGGGGAAAYDMGDSAGSGSALYDMGDDGSASPNRASMTKSSTGYIDVDTRTL